MRVAFVITKLFGGGTERRALRTALGLSGLGEIEELLIACRQPQTEEIRARLAGVKKVRLEEIPRRRRWDLGHLRELGRVLREFSPQVVHAWQVQDLYWAAAARPRRAGLVGSLFNSGLMDEAGRLPYPRSIYLNVGTAARFAHLMLANCQAGIDNWSRLARIPRGKFRLLPNLVVFDPPPPLDDEERRQRREELGLSPDQVVALSVARLHLPMKGQDMALRAVAELAPRHPELVLLLAGDGPSREEVEELHRRLGLGERVRLLGWVERPHELLSLADLFLLASRTEGFPNALVEAMVMGVPVVASAVGAVPEILRQGERGILAEPTPEGIARALEGMLGELSRWREVARRQAEEVGREYSSESIIPRLLELYREAAKIAGASPL